MLLLGHFYTCINQYSAVKNMPSLVPRPPPFLPSVCVHNNTRNQKIGDELKQGRPGSIHHVSGCEVDVGGEGSIFKHILNLKASFLPVKMSI